MNYKFQNKKKKNYENEREEMQAEMSAERELLSLLEAQIVKNYESKKNHEKKIEEYRKLMYEIREKISSYIQKTQ